MGRNFFKRQSRGRSRPSGRKIKKFSRRRNRVGRFIDLGVEHLEDRRLLAAGDLDTTFGIAGFVVDDLGLGKREEINTSVVQADGKILVAGSVANTSGGSSRDFLLARYNSDGAIDTSFGTNGYTIVDVSDPGIAPTLNHDDQVNDILIQADGRIVVAGTASKLVGATRFNGIGIVRLTADGQLDTTFDGDGKSVTLLQDSLGQNSALSHVNAVAIQSSGKIVVGGRLVWATATEGDYFVARFNTNGSLDTSFDGDGYVVTNFDSTLANSRDDNLFALTVNAGDQIVAVGFSETNTAGHQGFSLARYNANGDLDLTFGGGDGKVTTDLAPSTTSQSQANAVQLEAGGKIVLGGWTTSGGNRDFSIARYDATGTLDTSFNSAGAVPGTLRITFGAADFGEGLVLQPQPDGKYVIGGTIGSGTTADFALARVTVGGVLDTSFSGDGRQNVHFAGTSTTRVADVVIQADGKVVLVGSVVPTGTNDDTAMARFETGLIVNTINGLGEITEDTIYTLYLTSNDPGAEAWFIDWNDGNTQTILGNPSSVSHLYADGTNTYSISATVTVSGSPVSAGTRTVKVNNVPPSLTVNQSSLVVSEGQTATNSGTFGDVPADTVTVVASIGTVTQNSGVWNWSYSTTDDFNGPVTITATDGDGGVTVAAFNLEVENVNPTLTVNQASVVAEVSQTVTNSGTYSDAGTDSVMLVASIGTVVNNNDGTWSWSYTTGMVPPEQTVTIAAIDDDNGFGLVTFSLSVAPTLSVAPDQVANEGTPLNITNIGTFTDIVQAGNEGWPVEIGLDANDFTTIGAFDPTSNVVFNTDTLTVSGGFSGVGATVTANTGFGNYQIAVFTFSVFELDAGITLTATGSRPIAILSQGNMSIAGTIDVSARSNGLPGVSYEQLAGPGGGNGGLSGSTMDHGDPAAGAPANSAGQYASGSGSGGGAGGGFGGRGGRAETNPSGDLQQIAQVGQPFANLAAGIQGGSGGGTGSAAFSGTFSGGGGGGGGLELGAVGVLSVATGGQILANGGDGQPLWTVSTDGTGGGGAGGGILLHATSVNQHGTLEAKGGNSGGIPRNGGGGGGGAILIVHNASGSFDNTGGTQSVNGGSAGLGGGGENGVVGVAAIQSDTPAATPIIESFDYVIDWGDGSTANSGAATIDTPGVNIGDVVLGSFDGSHIYAENGVYIVTVTINDSSGGSDTKTFAVTVNNVDPALTVDQASVAVNEGDAATNSGTYADVPADIVSISASVGTLVDNGDGTWSWSFVSTDGPVESQTVTITATDDDGGFTNITFDLAVNNLDPTVTVAQASVIGNEGQTVTNTGTYGDVPADTVSITASIGTVVFSGGAWTWSHIGADGLSTTTVTITATDDDGDSSDTTFDFIVNNVAPTLTVSSASVSANEGQTASNSGTYSDVPADTVTLVASIGAIVYGSGTWSWTFNGTDDLATNIVEITASDDDGGSTIATFDLTVNNAAPTLTANSASVTINEGQTAANSGTYADVPADTVLLTASIGIVVFSGGTWTWTYNGADDLATTSVEITASDEDGGSAIATFDLTVNNAAPTLTVDSASVTVSEGQTANNSGTYGDVPADSVSISASLGTVVFGGGTWTWSYNGTDDLATTITITASDDDGGSTIATFDLTVNNAAPTLTVNSPAVTVDETQTAANSGIYGDVPSDTVTLSASIGTVTYSAGTWSWSYNTADDMPATIVVITASDEDGGSTVATFSLTVNNVDPTASAGGPYFTFDDTPITLTGSGADVAGAADPLSYEWDLDNNGTFETAGQNAVFDPQALGFTGSQTRTVAFRVSDGDGGEVIATTSVEILGVGTALIDGVLHVVGSNAANDIVIITQSGGNINVLASFNNENPATFAAAAVTDIQVRLRDGHDILVTTPNVTQSMTIDAGGGNDFVTGGGGRNVIYGGTGNDALHGAGGDDLLLGGDGNDDLFGGSGNDVLVGGNGSDFLTGGTGRDVIIGSQDEDRLMGGSDEDILIGGYTVHDNNIAALDAIMAIWGSAASFNARVAALTSAGGLLEANVAVFDDDDNDQIMGNSGRDLIFGDTNPWDGAIDQIALQSLQDVLVAVN